MAKAIRTGYADLFTRNENVYKLDKKSLEGLVVQATGLDAGSATLSAIVGTFERLKAFADFGAADLPKSKLIEQTPPPAPTPSGEDETDLRLGLSYTINLVLPRTDDVAVFNAIFRALRENLLRK